MHNPIALVAGGWATLYEDDPGMWLQWIDTITDQIHEMDAPTKMEQYYIYVPSTWESSTCAPS